MESCPGSQWLARKLQASGHTVKIIPAQFVKPYVKSNKNDMVDAAAIAEAVTRPTMRFVQVRQPEQCARQAPLVPVCLIFTGTKNAGHSKVSHWSTPNIAEPKKELWSAMTETV
jgi:hypothetical protein